METWGRKARVYGVCITVYYDCSVAEFTCSATFFYFLKIAENERNELHRTENYVKGR